MNGWWDPNKVEADDTETGERARPLLGVQRWDMFSPSMQSSSVDELLLGGSEQSGE